MPKAGPIYFKHVQHVERFKHVQTLVLKMIRRFKMTGPPPGRHNSKQFEHVETQGFNMLNMVKMLAVRLRPKHFSRLSRF